MNSRRLETLRSQLEQVDSEVIERVSRRLELAAEIGAEERRTLRQAQDFHREAVVLEQARNAAQQHGVPQDLAEKLMGLVTRSSLQVQEQDRVALAGVGQGRRALVIGGSGRMGGWFVRFLLSQGFEVSVADPEKAPEQVSTVEDWRTLELNHELIVVAAPLQESALILEELAEAPPGGVIFDIASLKSPVAAGLRALARAGAQVTSIHPMFGPDALLLSGRHVVFCDLGCAAANRSAQSLFDATTAIQVTMQLEEHDRAIAFVLGLSHAVSLCFLSALGKSGEAAGHLAELSSTTFQAQLDLASTVSAESPQLYYEIQKLNPFGDQALEALLASVKELRGVVTRGDDSAFREIMEAGHRYVRER